MSWSDGCRGDVQWSRWRLTSCVIGLGLALVLVSCGQASGTLKPGMTRLEFEGTEHVVWVVLAADNASQKRGLGYRAALPDDEGLLFIYPEAGRRVLSMKNVRIPLDLAYIDDDGVIVDVMSMETEPGGAGTKLYRSSSPVRYALEVNRGWFSARGIGPGTRIESLPSYTQARRR